MRLREERTSSIRAAGGEAVFLPGVVTCARAGLGVPTPDPRSRIAERIASLPRFISSSCLGRNFRPRGLCSHAAVRGGPTVSVEGGMSGTQKRFVCGKCGKVFFAWRPDTAPGAKIKCYFCKNEMVDEAAERAP